MTAYQLARSLNSHSSRIRIVEKEQKSAQDTYGRAVTLLPRSLELLDQLDLSDELAQQSLICRSTVIYRVGVEVKGRDWNFMERMQGTVWNFVTTLRQKYQEEIFRAALRRHGVEAEVGVELIELEIDESVPVEDYRITASIRENETG